MGSRWITGKHFLFSFKVRFVLVWRLSGHDMRGFGKKEMHMNADRVSGVDGVVPGGNRDQCCSLGYVYSC